MKPLSPDAALALVAPDSSDTMGIMRQRAHVALDGLFDRFPFDAIRSTMKMSEDQFRVEVILDSADRPRNRP